MCAIFSQGKGWKCNKRIAKPEDNVAICDLQIANYMFISFMKAHNGMRPYDLAILYQIVLANHQAMNIELSRDLRISLSEVGNSINRSKIAGLIMSHKVQINTLLEFIQYGLPYVFPAIQGRISRGIITAQPLHGNTKGVSIDPLYPKVTEAIQENDKLYELLSLTDIIRVGKVREKELAIKLIILEQYTKI
ncbi:hypothetical protein ADIARSV_2799 [Arcticibacter svalbardensis MN12-7]|uniref:Uncharacterized protein n=1 Tax=Arcticibacter svalbardensis MN12-7 TaxID=1150600 RepID=R9GQY5_9SPHI|nr:hypothetical protein [Arcticibacter svalbardensis]EOR93965.1 hypothetical protein ADIARSV_2799 [Arcticibacter svalbardensis MN12-7]